MCMFLKRITDGVQFSPYSILPFHPPCHKLASNLAVSVSSWPLYVVRSKSANRSTGTFIIRRGYPSINIKYSEMWPQQHGFLDQRVFVFYTEVKNGTPKKPQCTVIIWTNYVYISMTRGFQYAEKCLAALVRTLSTGHWVVCISFSYDTPYRFILG